MGARAPFKAGDRVGAIYLSKRGGTTLAPGIVRSAERSDSGVWYGVIRFDHGEFRKQLHSDFVQRDRQMLADTQVLWEAHWADLEREDWEPNKESPDYEEPKSA